MSERKTNMGGRQTRGGHSGREDQTVLSSPAVAAAAGPDKAAEISAKPSVASGSVPDVSMPGIGTRINQYELIRELGRGGMGSVYLARDTKLGRRVAIKIMHSHKREITERFILEARATARCQHEHIVIIHDVGEYQGNPFMVLEYLQGKPLSALMDGTPFAPSRAVEIAIPVVQALVRAHELDIVHRDLKPANIFVTDSGTIKVLDFGIAKVVGPQPEALSGPIATPAFTPLVPTSEPNERADRIMPTELTRHGALVGTISYMSPEQWGADTVDHRTDLWAMGIILFTMVAGKHPLAPLRGQELVVTALLDDPMPSVLRVRPDLPQELANAIDRCLVKRKHQRMGSAQELLEALEPLRPGRYNRTISARQSPYAGMTAFQEIDADRFFGRSRDIAALLIRLRDQPLIGVVGPSGVGKSSFVRAGVVPALKHSGEIWETLVVRPGRQPVAALSSALTPMMTSASDTLDDEAVKQHLLSQRLCTEPGYLGAVLRSRARRQQCKILLFVDQFEELYTLIPDPQERRAFTACLAGVADDATTPLRVVLSIRSDFLDRVAEDPYFMGELAQGLFFLNPLDRDSLRDALVRPAELAGHRFETAAMIEDMLDTLATTPGALPLLQFAANKLWEARDQEQKRLTEAGYRHIGGIIGALASHADAVLAELSPSARHLVRAIFLRLVTPERTRAIATVTELRDLSPNSDEIQRLVDQLVHARLLVVHISASDGTVSEPAVEIVHEALIHSWPLLHRWLDENQDDAAFLEQLRTAAKQWSAKGRPNGLLWRGEAMEEAQRWYQRYRGDLSGLETAYLNAAFTLATRSRRIKRLLVGGTIGALSLLVVSSGVTLVLIRNAEREATHQAVAASRAEQMARKRSTALQQEILVRQRAEQEAKEALLLAEEAKETAEIEKEKALYERARAEKEQQRAEYEKQRAEREKRRALRERRRALKASQKAQMSEIETRRAKHKIEALLAKVQVLLQREQERAMRLERALGSKILEVLR